ncbi:MAG: replication protein [Castellaniella sp.]|nr:replication protein [Castellaniella sp.]
MAQRKSPQVEDGHVRIANELYDAIFAFGFKSSTLHVLMIILRKTYGYGKKEDDISASQIGSMCNMGRQHVTTALNELAAMGVIHKRAGKYGAIIGINKDYSAWSASPKSGQVDSPNLGQVSESWTSPNLGQVSKNGTLDSPKSGQVDSPNLGHTKDNLPKDNQQKKEDADASSAPSGKISLDAAGHWIGIPQALLATWSTAYPALSLDAELAKAAAWILANPKNKKSNYARYLTNWLSRAQDSARPSAASAQRGFDPLAYINRNRTKPGESHVIDA